MRISDWSSDVCSSDLKVEFGFQLVVGRLHFRRPWQRELRTRLIQHRRRWILIDLEQFFDGLRHDAIRSWIIVFTGIARSEERRVGKECISTCSIRWSSYH